MKHIELAKKLKALADKGIGGEKINAEKMLSLLLKKHKLIIDDIEGEKTENYFFKIKKGDARLLNQIVKRVNHNLSLYGEFPAKKVKQLGLKGNYMTTCTAFEFIEIESMFDIYQKLYNSELNIFYSAFLKANDLLVKSPDCKSTKDLTHEEYEEWLRINEMASKIKKENFRKQLTQ